MAWRLAKSLEKLREQVNTQWPLRSKVSDGTIGDPAHSARTSDHNPLPNGAVCALDITHDPSQGLDSEVLAETLRNSRDPRTKYIISNRKIASVQDNWAWRKYTGSNPHDHHVHVSVHGSYDDMSAWAIEGASRPAVPPAKLPPSKPVLRKGLTGEAVKALQRLLVAKGGSVNIDGNFGPKTERAVKDFQISEGIVADGICGPQTWGLLEGK